MAGKCSFMAYSGCRVPSGPPGAAVRAISSAACLQNKSRRLSLLSMSDYFKETACVLSLSAYNSNGLGWGKLVFHAVAPTLGTVSAVRYWPRSSATGAARQPQLQGSTSGWRRAEKSRHLNIFWPCFAFNYKEGVFTLVFVQTC